MALSGSLMPGMSPTQAESYTRPVCGMAGKAGRAISADTWDLKDRQVEEYIKRARDYQRLDAELERPEWLHESLSALKDIQRKATTRQQYSTALKAIEMQARLLRFEMS